MQKYVPCLKILDDTRVPERGHTESLYAKRIRVSAFRRTLNLKRQIGLLRLESPDFSREGVFLVENFYKKCSKNSRFDSWCPLIILTKGGTMINNMVLSREIEWIGYEHKRNMLQVEFIVGAIYQYENVPETVYQEFLTAPSHGRFFESNIKNKYQVRKVR